MSMVRGTAAVLLVLVFASGCGRTPVVPTPPEPPPESCAAECRQPCDTAGIELVLEEGATDAFDQLVLQVVIPLRARLQQCSDIHRGACVQCLDRLREVGVTR